MSRGISILMTAAAVIAIFWINYGLALIGEPRAVWLMKVLGVMP